MKGRARSMISDYFYVYSHSDERSKANVKEIGYVSQTENPFIFIVFPLFSQIMREASSSEKQNC